MNTNMYLGDRGLRIGREKTVVRLWMALNAVIKSLGFSFSSIGSLPKLDDMLHHDNLTIPFLQRGKLARRNRLTL